MVRRRAVAGSPCSSAALGFVAALLILGSASGQQGAIELFVGETLFKGGTRVSATFLHQEGGGLLSGTSSVANPSRLRLDRDVFVLGVTHGIRRGTDLTLLTPLLRTGATFEDETGTLFDTNSTDLGDLSLTVRQRVFHTAWERGGWSTSILAGMQFPTGEVDAREDGVRLPPELQAGSGSFDPYVGIASTLEFDRLRIDGSLFYLRSTEGAQDFDAGDVFSASLTAGYRVIMNRYPGPTVGVKTGLRYRRQGQAHLDGDLLDSSGREELAVQFGVTYHPAPEWDIVATLEVPFYQDVKGSQLSVDYRVLLGVGCRF